MTKPRAPISIDAALARIAGQLGSWAPLATATGYHERTVRAWADPDREEVIPLPACITLGILFRQSGGVGDPLLEAHGDLVGAADVAAFGDRQELQRETIDAHRESSEAIVALLELSQPDAGEAEQVIAEREALQARNKWDRILAKLAGLGRNQKPP